MASASWNGIDLAENRARMERGELYTAFVPDLTADRRKASQACDAYNRNALNVSRREQVELLRQCVVSLPELPPKKDNQDEDDEQLGDYPWVEPPMKLDYRERISFGKNVFLNFNFVCLNTCSVTIGSRVLCGSNVSLLSGTHPTDPAIRNGTAGPEMGAPIEIGDDCWLAANVCVLPGVKIGRGTTIGAGSVVTKSVPPFVVAVGNPARVIKKVESEWATAYFAEHPDEEWFPPAQASK
ncbi:hypothetical protein JCM10449v2_005666 [Rhodotorula kratochvilovae]